MKYKHLGRTGISVSELCFGTMSFGGDADEATSAALYKEVRDAGINFFDCANEYNKGKSEEILGRLAKSHRDDLVLTTKCFNPTSPDVNARGASRRHVVQAVEASLKRLQTDRIDVLFLHRFDPVTPIDEMMRALEDMVRAGKVIYPAVSNWAAWQTQRAVDLQEVLRPGVGTAQDQQDVRGTLRRQMDVRGRGEIRGVLQAEGPASGQHGDCLGGRASRDHGAHHRGTQCRPAEGLTRRGKGRHDAGAARRDRRPLAPAAAGHRSIGRAEGGEGRGVAATSSRKTAMVHDAARISGRPNRCALLLALSQKCRSFSRGFYVI